MAIAAGRRDSITPKGYACTSRSRGPRDEADGEAHRLRGWGTRGKAEAAGHHRDAAAAATRWGSVLGQANALLGVGRYAEDEEARREGEAIFERLDAVPLTATGTRLRPAPQITSGKAMNSTSVSWFAQQFGYVTRPDLQL
jgi:hypothetical protein